MKSPARSVSALATLGLSLVVGCGGGASSNTPAPSGVDAASNVTLTVQNQRVQEARLWIHIEGRRQQLGALQGNQSQSFPLSIDRSSLAQLEVRITQGPECMSEDVTLRPGETIVARIPVNLSAFVGTCR